MYSISAAYWILVCIQYMSMLMSTAISIKVAPPSKAKKSSMSAKAAGNR